MISMYSKCDTSKVYFDCVLNVMITQVKEGLNLMNFLIFDK